MEVFEICHQHPHSHRRIPERSALTGGWWGRAESNRRRQPFQGCALPTELPPQIRSCVQEPCDALRVA